MLEAVSLCGSRLRETAASFSMKHIKLQICPSTHPSQHPSIHYDAVTKNASCVVILKILFPTLLHWFEQCTSSHLSRIQRSLMPLLVSSFPLPDNNFSAEQVERLRDGASSRASNHKHSHYHYHNSYDHHNLHRDHKADRVTYQRPRCRAEKSLKGTQLHLSPF